MIFRNRNFNPCLTISLKLLSVCVWCNKTASSWAWGSVSQSVSLLPELRNDHDLFWLFRTFIRLAPRRSHSLMVLRAQGNATHTRSYIIVKLHQICDNVLFTFLLRLGSFRNGGIHEILSWFLKVKTVAPTTERTWLFSVILRGRPARQCWTNWHRAGHVCRFFFILRGQISLIQTPRFKRNTTSRESFIAFLRVVSSTERAGAAVFVYTFT